MWFVLLLLFFFIQIEMIQEYKIISGHEEREESIHSIYIERKMSSFQRRKRNHINVDEEKRTGCLIENSYIAYMHGFEIIPMLNMRKLLSKYVSIARNCCFRLTIVYTVSRINCSCGYNFNCSNVSVRLSVVN